MSLTLAKTLRKTVSGCICCDALVKFMLLRSLNAYSIAIKEQHPLPAPFRIAIVLAAVTFGGCSSQSASDTDSVNAANATTDTNSSTETTSEPLIGNGCDYLPGEAIEHLDVESRNSALLPTSDLHMRIGLNIYDAATELHYYPDRTPPRAALGFSIADGPNLKYWEPGSTWSEDYLPLSVAGGDRAAIIAQNQRAEPSEGGVVIGLVPNKIIEYERAGRYGMRWNQFEPGDCVRVSIERSNGDANALDTILKLNSIPTLVSPLNDDTYHVNDELSIDWVIEGENEVRLSTKGLQELKAELVCGIDGEFHSVDKWRIEYWEDENGELLYENGGTHFVSPFTATVSDFMGGSQLQQFASLPEPPACKLILTIELIEQLEVSIRYDKNLFNSVNPQAASLFLRPNLNRSLFVRTINLNY